MDDLEALEWGDEVLALLKSTSEEPDCLDAPATVASPHRTPMSDDSVREPGARLERPEPNPPEPEPFPQPPPSPFPQPFPGPFPDPLPEPYPEEGINQEHHHGEFLNGSSATAGFESVFMPWR
jgi:hypothetical protein